MGTVPHCSRLRYRSLLSKGVTVHRGAVWKVIFVLCTFLNLLHICQLAFILQSWVFYLALTFSCFLSTRRNHTQLNATAEHLLLTNLRRVPAVSSRCENPHSFKQCRNKCCVLSRYVRISCTPLKTAVPYHFNNEIWDLLTDVI